MLLFGLRAVLNCFVVQAIGRVTPNQTDKQRDNVLKQRFAFVQFGFREQLFNKDKVETTSTFQTRAVGDVEKLAAIGEVKRPLPSGMFSTMEVRARSSWLQTAIDFGMRTRIDSLHVANASAFR